VYEVVPSLIATGCRATKANPGAIGLATCGEGTEARAKENNTIPTLSGAGFIRQRCLMNDPDTERDPDTVPGLCAADETSILRSE